MNPYVPSKKTDGKSEDREILDPLAKALADGIAQVAAKYKYDGAFLGELNYSLTRLIQHLPRSLMKFQGFASELRYWMYAGIVGVLVDVKDEYKRRVNTSYEAAQIVKSGDCYDAPYYTKLLEVLDSSGNYLGHMEVMVKRSDNTLNKDVLDDKIALVRTSE